MKETEAQIQIKCVNWLRDNTDILIFAFCAENKRSAKTGQIHKLMGQISGVPDLFIPEFNIWIEMKTEIGIVSKNQKETHKKLENIGHKVFVCRSLDEFKNIINENCQ